MDVAIAREPMHVTVRKRARKIPQCHRKLL